MKDLIEEVLIGILKGLDLPFTKISIDDTEDMIRVDIDSPKASYLIGWHGETINAIQQLTKAIIRTKKNLQRSPFIVLDVDGYHRAQEEKVCATAEQKAEFVRRKKTKVALPPMSPYFRRVVHTYVTNNPDMQDLTTESIGEGDYRQIVLKLKEGSIDEGEELAPIITEEKDEGFENLDV